MYDMYPWDDPADSRSAELRTIPAAATRAVQVALDRRDNGGDPRHDEPHDTGPATAGHARK